MSTSKVSSCRVLQLRVGKLLYTNGSIVPRATGVRLFFARFCSPPLSCTKPVPFESTGIAATKYAETKRVHEVGAEVQPLECGLKIAVYRLQCSKVNN